ncbi:MAG: hypothetical protein ABIG44_01140 [Planctomycetota bacterium]
MRVSRGKYAGCLVWWLVLCAPVGLCAQNAVTTTQPVLSERQAAVRDRVRQLESRMLMLTRVLAETEPEKAERLRQALDWSGRQRIRHRVEQLVELLRTGDLSDAENQQAALLSDLQDMLDLLTATTDQFERKREERKRLEGFKRAIRILAEDQLEQLYRTQQATESERAVMRELEQEQRALERRAADLIREMEAPDRDSAQTPGQHQLSGAREQMQAGADRLAEMQPQAAQARQREALQELQSAMDALNDALRQVRREELEETLTAVEARIKSMLAREHAIQADVKDLHKLGAANWNRNDQLKLDAAAQQQQAVAGDCQDLVNILIGEGTTVVLPELANQLAADMVEIATRLDRADTSAGTQDLLEHVIATLEEILGAIEVRRQEELELMQQSAAGSPDSGSQPLLHPSAELKLLRSSQVLINRRTMELAEATAVGDITEPQRCTLLRGLSQRQRALEEMARRMNERK